MTSYDMVVTSRRWQRFQIKIYFLPIYNFWLFVYHL
jgi:hypothetical protein